MARQSGDQPAAPIPYDDLEQVPYNRVAVVLGTSKSSDRRWSQSIFSKPIDATVAPYFSGKINQVIVSGDNATMSYNEPREMPKLLKRGIPARAIYSDYAGFRNTRLDLMAHGVFGQTRFTVVSQRFQNERAIFSLIIILDVVGFNAKDVDAYTGFKTRSEKYLPACGVCLMSISGNVSHGLWANKLRWNK